MLPVPNNPYGVCGRKAAMNLNQPELNGRKATTLIFNTKCFQTSGHVPVLTIMTSRPVWGIIITHTCSNFGTYTFLTNIPTYLKEVLHFDIKQVRVLREDDSYSSIWPHLLHTADQLPIAVDQLHKL